jgi:hypothetical protein
MCPSVASFSHPVWIELWSIARFGANRCRQSGNPPTPGAWEQPKMRNPDHGRHVLRAALLAIAYVASGSVCFAQTNSVPARTVAARSACQAVPQADRDHIHVFLINGLDPLSSGNFRGVAEQVRRLGFQHVNYGQMYNQPSMRREVIRIHQQDSQAKFVVVGYSFGANLAASLTRAVQTDGVAIDLLVYLAGDTMSNSPKNRPENARRIINITAHGCVFLLGGVVWQGEDLDGANNLRLTGASHGDVPTHEQTMQLLVEGLVEVARSVSEKVN